MQWPTQAQRNRQPLNSDSYLSADLKIFDASHALYKFILGGNTLQLVHASHLLQWRTDLSGVLGQNVEC